ncbi:MAG: glycan metabolism protein RagB [Bacteroidetes bacterium GWF2_42_66]|nr:MAG: glycan metabolism protein RagB [Bacteroidetes bacterium GWA2_42_15]OFX99721.1 MAG: glycan metabolism protein RagB [Bacteroidetes bacterium GWE2_42_39]OFY39759.1 MAG: glycan metabolism protein RagB [Bacteroidetes bacterium GWF2_42_66]HBL74823.1 RagB/SusD family nutrient uptake outer membrane protein [Prolixibacteraceae bacterium]HCU61065.1 RagB/SusD family nutrient uptake outer membrane protein [Prolixibacteraceae bacterium]
MKKIYSISFIALLLFGLTGCDKDFLEVQPTEFLTEQQVAEAAKNNPDVIAGSMSGIYTLMFQTGTGGTDLDHDDFGQKGYDIYIDFLSGDMALSVSTYGWYRGLTEFQDNTDFTDNTNYKPWRYYYRLIRSANSVISALGGNDAVPELDENKYIMGQAKAMRAHSYFYLSQMFATSYDPAAEILPIYTDPLQQNQPKSTTQDVFDLIVSDLTDAISLLDGFNRSAKNEVNKYVAEGMLAYVYALMGGNDNYLKAKNLTADVIANGGFTLLPADEVVFTGVGTKGGFNNVNSPSWMWGVDLTLDNGLDLVSWWGQMDRYTYSYQWAGDRKAIDKGLYDLIPAVDVRKKQFNSVSTSSYFLTPSDKFYDPNRVTGGQRNVITDYVYMRVEEMYLLNAEAAAKSGDEATAKASLKALVSLRVPNANYVDGLSGQSLTNEIYLQTRIELWGEGKSYLAMKRNKATIVRGSNHLSNVGVAIPYNDPRLSFVIPQSEIQNNPFID